MRTASTALAFSVCAFLSLNFSYAATLTTDNYVVEITNNCEEGTVSCDDVTYVGTSKTSGESIELKGTTWHSMCADGVSPCRFLGYIFENGEYTYTLDESGTLKVTQQDETLVEESGEWSY